MSVVQEDVKAYSEKRILTDGGLTTSLNLMFNFNIPKPWLSSSFVFFDAKNRGRIIIDHGRGRAICSQPS
jgi:hypothetical protein